MKKIIIPILTVVVMIGLIPFVSDDYALTALYVLIISGSLYLSIEKRDWVIFIVGFFS